MNDRGIGRLIAAVMIVVFAIAAHAQQQPHPLAQQLRLTLPPDIYAVPGHEVNIYFDNIVLCPDSDDLVFDVDCNRGRQDEKRWRYTPDGSTIGQFSLAIRVLTPDMELIDEASTMIHVSPADAGAGEEISLLIVGDSLTNATYYPREVYKLMQGESNPALTMVGSHAGGGKNPTDGVAHEGYGGWRWSTFCTRWSDDDPYRGKSKFLREIDGEPTLDFQRYLDTYNDGEAPDFITVLLGCNDTFSATEEDIEERIDDMFGWADKLLAEFQSVAPDTQIGILLLVPPSASQDAFGRNYKCRQTRWQYRRNQHRVVERQLEKFGDSADDNIFIVPANVNLDCEHNYPAREEPVNARNDTKIQRASNGVHPAPEGYYQIADSIYYWLKYRLSR